MPKYRKLPVVIEAIHYDWDDNEKCADEAQDEVCDFMDGNIFIDSDDDIEIETLEGTMYAKKGDYIIKGVNGEFYPCKPDIFAKTYEQVDVPDSPESNQEVAITEIEAVFYDIQEQEKVMTGLVEKANRAGCNGRLVAMANTDFERGFMALGKSLNKTIDKD